MGWNSWANCNKETTAVRHAVLCHSLKRRLTSVVTKPFRALIGREDSWRARLDTNESSIFNFYTYVHCAYTRLWQGGTPRPCGPHRNRLPQ